ncbi:MAG: hypothetical protein EBT36_10215 [Betaproteobacteria bacterium]|jgi:hypothetical protein|nr:hypothetical protein [Pseudomonadota bacterium]NBO04159.1 hypothetical protein [Betaproteobacteria bacterium]HAB46868.1 hypothetical protein [Lautropia sp.]NBO94366.1 hypothetical protein [Betaproteobacteria bacterium]NBP36129.1 hypothetical protein [Betaproteobacteria bacterium]
MKVVLGFVIVLALSACSMFQRDRPGVKTGEAPQKQLAVATGMTGMDVERLLGKPNRVSTEPCKLANSKSECLVWRFTERRQATVWFHGAEPSVVMFDLDAVR